VKRVEKRSHLQQLTQQATKATTKPSKSRTTEYQDASAILEAGCYITAPDKFPNKAWRLLCQHPNPNT